MSTQDLRSRNSKLLQRYQSKAASQDPLQQPIDTTPFSKSTSQRSLQNSTLLQKHYARTNSQNIPSDISIPPDSSSVAVNKVSGSQRSLERSKLLQRYTKQHSLDSQDVPKAAETQIYSSQKSLENSKLMQRYNPTNNSQDFAGLSVREGTPVTRFTRSGSLDQDRLVRPSLLSRYTPRFGKSLDRNKSFETEAYSSYSSQHSLDQPDPAKSISQSQTFGDYGSDHYDQYDSRNLRSRSSSMAKGLARRSASREMLPPSKRVQLEKENIPLDPVTPETLPMITAPEPVVGNIASALPMPLLNIVPPTPMVEVSPPTIKPIDQPIPAQSIISPEPIKTPRAEPVKPPRRDLSTSATHLYPAEVPLAEEESFTTPLPTPRRSRSRSQLSKYSEDDQAFRSSYVFGLEDSAMDKSILGMSESNGYATVRKEPPPRPPAPIRRRKSTRSLEGQRQFSTLPNYHSVSPMRPTRNYSTISPNRPPRNKSISSLNENQPKLTRDSSEDIRQYEEIEEMEYQLRLQQALQSGAVVSKMKDRPLPPPPRPPRDGRKPRRHDTEDDFDGGAERIVLLDQSAPRVVEEVEIAIQTDPVSEDYELDIEVSETIGAIGGDPFERPSKTLQEILKEEQQAEIDRARQLAEANNLMRGIQKFRDSTSSLSLQGSRPETPAASVLIERRVSTPYTSNGRTEETFAIRPVVSSDNLTEQDLADDDKLIAELVKKYVSDEKVTEIPKKPAKFTAQPAPDNVEVSIAREEHSAVKSEPAAPPRRRSLVSSNQDLTRSVEIPTNVIEEIVERLRTNEQQHIAELQQLHQQQVEDLRKHQEEQRQMQEQKLEEQQRQLLQQQNQQLQETQQLKEQILQQQEQQKTLLQQQQQQQQQLLLAQQQQQILLQQQEKERELQRERERELLREREIELEKARDRERELHHARELELQRARDLEQQRSKELEQQRLRELELQRTMEVEHQRLRELEIQRIQEAEAQRAREAELQRAREAELQMVREAEIHRIREAEAQRIIQLEKLVIKEVEHKESVTSEAPEQSREVDKLQVPDTDPSAPDSRSQKAEATKEPAPTRPPLPRYSPQPPLPAQFPYQDYLQYPLPPQAFYPSQNYSDDEGASPQAPHRRRRHHRSRRESTSEEEFQREQRKQRHGTRSPEPSIPTLSNQLIRACGSSIAQTGEELMSVLRASSKDENKRDLHVALLILIVIVAGLMALGMSAEKAVHHHHWDYFNPPGNSGNA